MNQYLLAILFCLSATSLSAQNVIGMKSGDVESYFKSNYSYLSLESNIKNEHYRYLKFSDANSKQVTVLAFLNEKGRCTAARFIYDLSMEDKVQKELNNKFRKTGCNTWEDRTKKKKIVIIYKKEEWFITVNYREE